MSLPGHGNTLVRRLARSAISAALLTLAVPLSAAQADRSDVERLALARARAEICEAISKMPIDGSFTFGGWAARDIELDRAVRAWIRTAGSAESVQVYSDMTCDVSIELSADALIGQVRDWHARYPKASPENVPTVDALIAAIRSWPPLRAAGTGEAPVGDIAQRPPGWEDASEAAIALAKRASTADALYHLFEDVARLKVTSARRMSEFLSSSELVQRSVMSGIAAAASCDVRLGPDQVAEATARIAISDVIRIVADVHKDHYTGDLFNADAFREMALNAASGELKATGLAAPPAQSPGAFDVATRIAPGWAGQTAEAVGIYLRPDSAADRSFAESEARADAAERLREIVMAYELSGGRRVSEVLAVRPHLAADVEVFLGAARLLPPATARSDGAVEQRLVLPLERLWRIMRRGLHEIESIPPGKPASSSLKSEVES